MDAVPATPPPSLGALGAVLSGGRALVSPSKAARKDTARPITFAGRDLNILYTADALTAKDWMRTHFPASSIKRHTGPRVMGLDVEWRPTFEPGRPARRAAVVQLSSNTDALVLHVFHMNGIPAPVRAVLESDEVLKVGVGVVEDARKLWGDYGVAVAGCLDLAEIVKQRGTVVEKMSLAGLADHFLSLPTWKKRRVTMSNWEKRPLTAAQKQYAALDAWVGAAMFSRMKITPEELRAMVTPTESVVSPPPSSKSKRRPAFRSPPKRQIVQPRASNFSVHLRFEDDSPAPSRRSPVARPAPVAAPKPVVAPVTMSAFGAALGSGRPSGTRFVVQMEDGVKSKPRTLVQPVAAPTGAGATSTQAGKKKHKKHKKERKRKKDKEEVSGAAASAPAPAPALAPSAGHKKESKKESKKEKKEKKAKKAKKAKKRSNKTVGEAEAPSPAKKLKNRH